VTLTNTGNSALPVSGNLGYTLAGSARFARVTGGAFPSDAPNCAAALAVGAMCTVKLQFAPTAAATGAQSATLSFAGTGVSFSTPAGAGAVVSLAGTGVASRAAAAISPNPLFITLLSPTTSPLDPGATSLTGLVTLTNNAAAGGSQVSVTGIAVNSGRGGSFLIGPNAGPDNCTGVALAPGASCTVTVRFSVGGNAPRGGTVNGTITFTDTATGSQQTANLRGVVTP
jgi:hypothetical protein